MERRRLLQALVIAAVLFCPLDASADQMRTFVDSAGRKVDLPSTINRAMAAGPPASIMLYALAPDKMVGWVRKPSPEEKAYLASAYRDLPVHGRLTGKGNTASLETVLAMKPDMILDVGTVDDTYVSLADRVQEQTGIPYILIDGSFAKTAESLRLVGGMLGVEVRGDELAQYADRVGARLGSVLTGVPGDKRPRVYYGRGPEGLETGLAGSINVEILEAVGATNVAAQAGEGGLANGSLEQVLSWNPDIVLALDEGFSKSIYKNPIWSGIAAVRNRKVYRVPTLPFGWFDLPPGINRLIGVSWLTSIFYPDQVGGNLRGETREFYKRFYHVDVTEEQLDRLLDGAIGSN